mmetsp:Transcript_53005/g.128590  ORF Transcript_53005/g.128590 Transcript_53005/m.128590 type:complete len:120 (-) Transcript_53005:179-538(-)
MTSKATAKREVLNNAVGVEFQFLIDSRILLAPDALVAAAPPRIRPTRFDTTADDGDNDKDDGDDDDEVVKCVLDRDDSTGWKCFIGVFLVSLCRCTPVTVPNCLCVVVVVVVANLRPVL